jgi:acetylornithine deacetylase or succinyl-diaminopimelate desuccinylase
MLEKAEMDEALALLHTMISCDTVNPPGNEKTLALQLQELLLNEDIDCQLDEFAANRANLIFKIKGQESSKALLVTGHLDTVPPGEMPWQYDPFLGAIENGYIYGRGVSDMKGSDAAMLYAIVRLKRKGIIPKQDVVFLATADEELSCLGAKRFVEQEGMVNIGAVLVGEPSDGDLLLAHKGAAWVEVTTHGRTAHGSMPNLGINAIMAMNDFLSAFTKQKFNIDPHPVLGMPTYSIDKVKGGVAINVVPDSCTCSIDFRTIPGQRKEDIESMLKVAFTEAKINNKQFSAEYKFKCLLPSVSCPAGDKIIDYALQAAGKKLRQRGVNYFTDASSLVGEKNLPVIIYGPGADSQAHQPNEKLALDKFFEAIEFYENFISSYKI